MIWATVVQLPKLGKASPDCGRGRENPKKVTLSQALSAGAPPNITDLCVPTLRVGKATFPVQSRTTHHKTM